MSYKIADFTGQAILVGLIHKWNPNRLADFQAVATALGTDTTTHDTTMQTAPAGLRPGQASNRRLTNDLLLIVNAGKGGNLTTAAMATALNSVISMVVPPTNTAPPSITYTSGGAGAGTQPGAIYARALGTWTPSGATMTQQWLRNGANIAGQTGTNYTTVAADAGTTLSCRVTATNPAGTNSAVSNTAAIT